MKTEDILNESIGSEISRKMTGRLSSKEHARSIGLNKLNFIARALEPKELRAMFPDMETGQVEFFMELRKEAIEGIKILKSIEQ